MIAEPDAMETVLSLTNSCTVCVGVGVLVGEGLLVKEAGKGKVQKFPAGNPRGP
jgi:hypothetical protein